MKAKYDKPCVVIPCLNEQRYISTVLDDLSAQTVKPTWVFVADAGSKDGTVGEIRKRQKRLNVEVVQGGLPAKGRNAGARACPKDSIIFFLDADVSIDKKFIETAIREMKARGLEAATCPNIPFYRAGEKGYKNALIRFCDRLIYVTHNFSLRASRLFRFPLATGTCIIATRAVFDKINGFDEKVKAFEDSDFVYSAFKAGKYGVLRNVRVLVSTRRFDKKGRFIFPLKIIFYGFFLRMSKSQSQMEYFDD